MKKLDEQKNGAPKQGIDWVRIAVYTTLFLFLGSVAYLRWFGTHRFIQIDTFHIVGFVGICLGYIFILYLLWRRDDMYRR